jgi:hypothetical protein
MGDRLGVAESLLALAGAALPDEPADAVRLLGASSAVLSAIGAVPTPRQEDDLDRAERAAVAAAGEETVATARSEGADLAEGAAIALALDLCDRLGAGHHASTTTT